MNFIKNKYGSYKGLARHLRASLAARVGWYSQSTQVDWTRVERLVFVCKGNVCRSPYAEMKARCLGVKAVSYGLHTSGNTPANESAIRVARSFKVDLASHRSRLFNIRDLSSNDLVLLFEPGHYRLVKQMAVAAGAQVTLVGMWLTEATCPLIADPFGRSDDYFSRCFAMIDHSLEQMVSVMSRTKLQDCLVANSRHGKRPP